MIYRDKKNPVDGRKWSIARNPSRVFVDYLDKHGYDIYITRDGDGITWAIYAMPAGA